MSGVGAKLAGVCLSQGESIAPVCGLIFLTGRKLPIFQDWKKSGCLTLSPWKWTELHSERGRGVSYFSTQYIGS